MLTKDEFLDWKDHPVTQELFEHIRKQIAEAKESLASDAGLNPLADRDLVGGIAAFREIEEWSPDLTEGKHEIH